MKIQIKGNMRDFDRATSRYLAVSRKLPAEVVNKNVNDVSLRSVQFAEHSTSSKIKDDLSKPSRTDSRVTVATMLTHKKGLDRAGIKAATARLLRYRARIANAIRGSLLQASKTFSKYVKGGRNGFVPRLKTSSKAGDGQPATGTGYTATASMWSNLGVGDSALTTLLNRMLGRGIDFVAKDREQYVRKKLSEAATKSGFKTS